MKVKSSIIDETIEIVNENGDIVLSLPFTVNVARTYERFIKARYDYKTIAESEDTEAVRGAVKELFCAAFGEEVTDKLLDYYKGDYFTMTADMTPLFSDIIYPAYEAYRENMLAAHKRAKR